MSTIKTTFSRAVLTMAAVAAAASLTACGGGGGGSSPAAPASNATPVTYVAASGTLKASHSTSTYTGGSMADQAYAALNTARMGAGAGAIDQTAPMDLAASKHADYFSSVASTRASSGYTGDALTRSLQLHNEYSDLVPANKFYAYAPLDRFVLAGAITAAGAGSENIAGAGTTASPDGTLCIRSLLTTVYHADTLLSSYTQVGIGQGADDAGNPACVVDYAQADEFGQVPAAGAVVTNPANNETGVWGRFAIASESPRPASTQITTANAGTPVLVNLRNATYVNAAKNGAVNLRVDSFQVTNGVGSTVSGVYLAGSEASSTAVTINSDGNLKPGTVVFIPTSALPAGTYTVQFSGAIIATFNGAQTITPVTKTWSFTTINN